MPLHSSSNEFSSGNLMNHASNLAAQAINQGVRRLAGDSVVEPKPTWIESGIELTELEKQEWSEIFLCLMCLAILIYCITSTFQHRRHWNWFHPALIMLISGILLLYFIIEIRIDSLVSRKSYRRINYYFLLPPIVLFEGFSARLGMFAKAEGLWRLLEQKMEDEEV